MTLPYPWNLLRSVLSGVPMAQPDDLAVDEDGWLVGQGVERVPSVRHSPLSGRTPIAIVWHYTATDHGTARALARRIRSYRKGVDRAASWHVCIAHDGVLWQSVPFLRGAWHCGRGAIEGHRVNRCSVGVELEGRGDSFPASQVLAAVRLVHVLAAAYPITREHAGYGHSQFDPKRRSDPGPQWMAELPSVLDGAFRRDD
jgi:N-acetyl-anhydromuramyl-L-alanine amidase AmpD